MGVETAVRNAVISDSFSYREFPHKTCEFLAVFKNIINEERHLSVDDRSILNRLTRYRFLSGGGDVLIAE
jgi:hypothetical protein